MKKLILAVIILLFAAGTTSAQKGKKKEEEKPPTQKEMEEMMKEMQKELGQMSDEDKKAMDSLGIKMPDMKQMQKNMSGVSDAQLKKAWEDENRIVPLKDADRIASISASPLNASSLAAFVTNQHNYTASQLLPASKTLGEKIYAQLKSKGLDAAAIGNNAASLWIMGRIQPAIYLMGRACTDDPSNSDNLNNYASMLSMCGAEQKAIPILNYLNSKFPKNSTLLNNLGQAWFGLGDMQKAEKYLDSTIRIYPFHPQATLTKSFIEENKGNKSEAIALVKKSMSHSYSQEKEERLRKMGYKLNHKDVPLPASANNDPLNLGGFTPPPFPKSVDECISLEASWKEFNASLTDRISPLKKQYEDALKIADAKQQERLNRDLNVIRASVAAGSPQGSIMPVPLYAPKAYLKLQDVYDEYTRKLNEFAKKSTAYATGKYASARKEYDNEMATLREQDDEQTGEGKPNKDFCPKYRDASDKYLHAVNTEKEKLYKEYLELMKKFLNDDTYWKMYSEWPERYTAYKLGAMISWLGALKQDNTLPFESITEFKCAPPKEAKLGKLSNFDDVACKYHSELRLGLGVMRSDCSNFTTEIDFGVAKFGLKQNMDKETFADQFVSCNVEIGAKLGRDAKLGPVTVEASAGARVGLEIDRNGVKDVYVVGGVKAGVGTNVISGASEAMGTPSSMAGQGVSDLSIDAGVEGRISIVSGRGSIYGTGIFQK